MDPNQDQFNRDCERYRLTHGSAALQPYGCYGNGDLFIVKHQSAEQVVLVSVPDANEVTVSSEEFSKGYWVWLQDETVFYVGSKEQQEAARAHWESVLATVKRVLYGNSKQLPALS